MLILSILIHANLLLGLNELVGEDFPSVNSAQKVLTVNLLKLDAVSKLNESQIDNSINIDVDNKVENNSNKISQIDTIKQKLVSENNSENKIRLDSPIYYTVSELDVVPAPLSDISQDLPQLNEFHSSGKLEIQLWLDENGIVESAKVIKTDLPDDLTKVFMDNFLALKFSEAVKNKVKVKSTLKINLNIES